MTHGHRQQCGDGQVGEWELGGGGQRGKMETSLIVLIIKVKKKNNGKNIKW